MLIVAAISSGRYNALQTRKAMWSQNIIKLREIYAHEDMLIGMKKIRKWYTKFNSTKKAVEHFIKYRDDEGDPAYKIDNYRRRFSHYLYTIYSLRKQKTVDDKFVKLMVDKDTIEKFLKECVDPLERAIMKQYDITAPVGEDMLSFYYRIYNIAPPKSKEI